MSGSTLALLITVLVMGAGALWWWSQRRRRSRQLYQRRLESALADGTLSAEEVAELERIRAQGDLSQAEVRMVARAIYRGALRQALEDARLSPEEDAALQRLQVQLGLSESDLGADLTHLSRLRTLARTNAGQLPDVESPIPLAPHERAHWVVQCTLADELNLPRSARTEVRGIRLEVGSPEPFNVAGERAALRPSERVLPTDMGVLVVSSRRTLFQGAKGSHSVPHARLEGIQVYQDGLRLDEIGGSARGFLLVDDAELTAAILLQAARRRRVEIRPSRSGRSA